MDSRRLRPALWAAAAAVAVALAGGLITDLGPWYQALREPPWKPPDWAFGPIWTVIFATAAIAGVRAWHARPDTVYRARLLALYTLNGLLNIAWSFLFFRVHRPDWAFTEVVLLWLSIGALIVVLSRASRLAAALLVPYLAWVTTAAFLNLAVVKLNQPFGGP